jgi:hypothetical protein
MGEYGIFPKRVFKVISNQPYILVQRNFMFSALKNSWSRAIKISILYLINYFIK